MNWDRIEGSWRQLKGNVQQQLGKLTDDHQDVGAGKCDPLAGPALAISEICTYLNVIAGKRDHPADKMREACCVTSDRAHQQLSVWQKMQKDQTGSGTQTTAS